MPPPPDPARDALRAELEARAAQLLRELGPDRLVPAAVIAPFRDRGVSRATLYRWLDEYLKRPSTGQALAREVDAAVRARAETSADPAADAAQDAGRALTPVPRIAADGPATQGIPILAHLVTCIRNAEELMAHSRTEEGKVRNARLLGSATELMRRNLETAVRMQEAMMQVSQAERFHAAVIEEVAKESPACAERLVMRLQQLTASWAST